jgi:hypothetical protein
MPSYVYTEIGPRAHCRLSVSVADRKGPGPSPHPPPPPPSFHLSLLLVFYVLVPSTGVSLSAARFCCLCLYVPSVLIKHSRRSTDITDSKARFSPPTSTCFISNIISLGLRSISEASEPRPWGTLLLSLAVLCVLRGRFCAVYRTFLQRSFKQSTYCNCCDCSS